jgi:hypothetical protein
MLERNWAVSKGYIIFAHGEKFVNMARLLERSIKATQTINNVTVIECGADIMLERTRAYELSPYDETVILDADMLFLDNIDHWWDHLAKFPLLITNKVRDFRDNQITNSPYRITFVSNNLPSCYTAFAYFNRNSQAEEFFRVLRQIVANWNEWSWRYTPVNRQAHPSIDIAMGIAVAYMGIHPFTPLDYPTFTHMKPETWRTYQTLNVHPGQVKIGNYVQTGILHYVDKDIVDELASVF